MPSRTVVWTLAALAVVLVVAPLLGMLGMSACCGGMSGMGMGMGMGNMMGGMSVVGLVWMLLAAGVVIALVVVLVRSVSRT